MAELEFAALLSDLIHREIDDPTEAVSVFLDKVEPRTQHRTQDSRALLRKTEFFFGDERDECVWLQL